MKHPIILPYLQWRQLEKRLNQRLPGEETLPALDSFQIKGENALKEILSKRGVEKLDWEVPFHYQRCPVLYCYIQNTRILSRELLDDISRIFPSEPFPWYAQIECEEEAIWGTIIIRDQECFFNAEDPFIPYCTELLGVSRMKAHFLKIKSLAFSFPLHINMNYKIWGLRGIFR